MHKRGKSSSELSKPGTNNPLRYTSNKERDLVKYLKRLKRDMGDKSHVITMPPGLEIELSASEGEDKNVERKASSIIDFDLNLRDDQKRCSSVGEMEIEDPKTQNFGWKEERKNLSGPFIVN